jgi:hypothetical protein
MKWINGLGIFFAVFGGFLLGIAVTSLQTMPSWWWLLSLLFICLGSLVGIISKDERPEK